MIAFTWLQASLLGAFTVQVMNPTRDGSRTCQQGVSTTIFCNASPTFCLQKIFGLRIPNFSLPPQKSTFFGGSPCEISPKYLNIQWKQILMIDLPFGYGSSWLIELRTFGFCVFFSHDLQNDLAATPMAWSILPSSAICPEKAFSWFKCHEVGVLFHNRRFRSRCDHQSLAGQLKDSPHWLQLIYDDTNEIIWNATQKSSTWLSSVVTNGDYP